jgi:hypothetical protein
MFNQWVLVDVFLKGYSQSRARQRAFEAASVDGRRSPSPSVKLMLDEHLSQRLVEWTACVEFLFFLPRFELTVSCAIREQHRLRSLAVFEDTTNDFSVSASSNIALPESADDYDVPVVHHEDVDSIRVHGLHTIAGLDISFRENGDGSEGIATLAVLSYPSLKVHSFHLQSQ